MTANDKDQTFTVDKGAKIFQLGKTKKQPTVDVPGGRHFAGRVDQ